MEPTQNQGTYKINHSIEFALKIRCRIPQVDLENASFRIAKYTNKIPRKNRQSWKTNFVEIKV